MVQRKWEGIKEVPREENDQSTHVEFSKNQLLKRWALMFPYRRKESFIPVTPSYGTCAQLGRMHALLFSVGVRIYKVGEVKWRSKSFTYAGVRLFGGAAVCGALFAHL